MLDGRFDPALALLFTAEEHDLASAPPTLAILAAALVSLAIVAALCWPVT